MNFDDAVANIHDGTLTVTVPKQKPGSWQQLSAEGSRAELNARRQAADERKMQFMEIVCIALIAALATLTMCHAETQASS